MPLTASTAMLPAVELAVIRTLPANPLLMETSAMGVVAPASTVSEVGAVMAGLLAAEAMATRGAMRHPMTTAIPTPERRKSRRMIDHGANRGSR